MILSNIEMQKAMADGRLVIDPKPLPLRPNEDQTCPYDTHTVNLRLGSEMVVPLAGPFSFDLMAGGSLSDVPARGWKRSRFPPAATPSNGFILRWASPSNMCRCRSTTPSTAKRAPVWPVALKAVAASPDVGFWFILLHRPFTRDLTER